MKKKDHVNYSRHLGEKIIKNWEKMGYPSHFQCLDVWMIFSVIFIFCTLVELAIVCQLNRYRTPLPLLNKIK